MAEVETAPIPATESDSKPEESASTEDSPQVSADEPKANGRPVTNGKAA